ncbi:MAG: ribonuclease P protein component [Acidimicrobiales bacterium]
MSVSFLARPDWSRPEVAYAVNRKVGSAVQRNLLRRRMRAIVSDRSGELPVGAYLVRSGPTGPSLDFNELKVAMSRAIEKATSRPHPGSPDGILRTDGADG